VCRHHGVDDWKEFVPRRLWPHVPGRLPHATTIVDDFTRADGDTIGNQLSWTELVGDFDTVSNQASLTTTATDCFARADSDLSTDDHYAQVVGRVTDDAGSTAVYAVFRKDSSATMSFYLFNADFSANTVRLFKCVAGSFTGLGGGAVSMTLDANTDYVVKGQANSDDTIVGYIDAVEKQSVTDTSVTGNVRTGIGGFRTAGSVTFDLFEAADVGGGPVVISFKPYYANGQRTLSLHTGVL
jgi:hypothetical protein